MVNAAVKYQFLISFVLFSEHKPAASDRNDQNGCEDGYQATRHVMPSPAKKAGDDQNKRDS